MPMRRFIGALAISCALAVDLSLENDIDDLEIANTALIGKTIPLEADHHDKRQMGFKPPMRLLPIAPEYGMYGRPAQPEPYGPRQYGGGNWYNYYPPPQNRPYYPAPPRPIGSLPQSYGTSEPEPTALETQQSGEACHSQSPLHLLTQLDSAINAVSEARLHIESFLGVIRRRRPSIFMVPQIMITSARAAITIAKDLRNTVEDLGVHCVSHHSFRARILSSLLDLREMEHSLSSAITELIKSPFEGFENIASIFSDLESSLKYAVQAVAGDFDITSSSDDSSSSSSSTDSGFDAFTDFTDSGQTSQGSNPTATDAETSNGSITITSTESDGFASFSDTIPASSDIPQETADSGQIVFTFSTGKTYRFTDTLSLSGENGWIKELFTFTTVDVYKFTNTYDPVNDVVSLMLSPARTTSPSFRSFVATSPTSTIHVAHSTSSLILPPHTLRPSSQTFSQPTTKPGGQTHATYPVEDGRSMTKKTLSLGVDETAEKGSPTHHEASHLTRSNKLISTTRLDEHTKSSAPYVGLKSEASTRPLQGSITSDMRHLTMSTFSSSVKGHSHVVPASGGSFAVISLSPSPYAGKTFTTNTAASPTRNSLLRNKDHNEGAVPDGSTSGKRNPHQQ